jgi:hypothetical protein
VADSQLARLAKPFPQRLIHQNPSGGGSYVKHSVVTEKLLAVVGPYSFELVEVIRGQVAGVAPNPTASSKRGRDGTPTLDGAVVGAVCRLSARVDSVDCHIEEVGDCESPHNWPHDGARLKDAMSDALKRCAMRLGVTLHLWSQQEFSLYEQLRDKGTVIVHDGTPPIVLGAAANPTTHDVGEGTPASPDHSRSTGDVNGSDDAEGVPPRPLLKGRN